MKAFGYRPQSLLFLATSAMLILVSACGGSPPASPAGGPPGTIAPASASLAATTAPSSTSPATETTGAAPTSAAIATAKPSETPLPSATPVPSTTAQETSTPGPQASAKNLSWQLSNAGTRAQLGSVICPAEKTCLAAGSDRLVLKSTDGGATWSSKRIEAQAGFISEVYCTSESKCFALLGNPVFGTGGTYESADGGSTWKKSGDFGDLGAILKADCLDNGTCYGIGEQTVFTRGATDQGWKIVKNGVFPPPPPARYMVDIACPSEDVCLAVGANRTDNEGIILRISNAGANVERLSSLGSDLNKESFEAITCRKGGSCFAVGRFGVIAKSDDGGANWTRISWTPPKTDEGVFLDDINCPDSKVCYAVGGNPFTGHCCGLIIKTIDGGLTWTNEKLDLPLKLLSVSCISESQCVAVGDSGLIVRLTAAPVAAQPTATSAPAGPVILNAVMAAGVKGFDVPFGLTDTFPPDSREIHTVVTTNQAKAGTRIKIVWTAVDVGSARSPNTKLTEFSGTVEGSDSYDYYFTPGGTLAEGTYRVDLFVDDKLDRSLNFFIRKGASKAPANPTASPVGSCPPPPAHQSLPTIVESITMAKGFNSSSGEPTNPTSTFRTHDTFHAVVHVADAPENTRLKAVWFATDVGDAGPCNFQFTNPSETSSFSGTTNWDFTLNRGAGFPVGLYRVEIYVNDQFALQADFSVQ